MGREYDDHLHRALEPDRCRHQGRQGFSAPPRRGRFAPRGPWLRAYEDVEGFPRDRLPRNHSLAGLTNARAGPGTNCSWMMAEPIPPSLYWCRSLPHMSNRRDVDQRLTGTAFAQIDRAT